MILITRPEDSAKKLEKKLREFNIEYFTESLSVIKFKVKNFKKFNNKIYLVSSPRVVDLLIKKRFEYYKLKFLVIGSGSGKKMIESGFKNILGISDNRSKMLKIIKKLKKVSEIEYLTGTTLNKRFCNDIMKLNIILNTHSLYETRYIKNLSAKCEDLFRKKKIKIVLLYSNANALLMIHLIKKAKIDKFPSSFKFLCLSKKIAHLVSKEGFESIYSNQPNGLSMISTIRKNY